MTTMDFFGHQELARRNTRWLVVLFVLAVVGIVVSIYVVAALIFVGSGEVRTLWQPELLAVVALCVGATVGLAATFRTAQLRQGGPVVAGLLGGRPVDHGTRDAKEKMLLNVVEEIAIASGVPMPSVFVLDGESGLNAFAAGWGTRDAAVAVTRGLLDQLSRDELQGVIAHEFSHVFHGDMRLNIRLMGLLFGIVCIATAGELIVRTVGRTGMRSSGGKNKGGAAGIVLFGVALLVIGWIGIVFANLIKAAVSRQREFLADASAVAYTRNPLGIGMALARIGGLGSRIVNPHAKETSHMFFADGVAHWFGNLGATHPPIEQRIERIMPGFLRQLKQGGSLTAALQQTPVPAVAGVAGFAASAGRATGQGVEAAAITGLVGGVRPEFVAQARELIATLPLDVLGAARDPQRVRALVYALLHRGHEQDQMQRTLLQSRGAAIAHETSALTAALRGLDPTAMLPLFEIMIPALRRLPPDEIAVLHEDAMALAHADERMTAFEFALLKGLRRHAPPPGAPPLSSRGRPIAMASAAAEVELVLSVMARAGAADEAAARDALAAAAQGLVGMPAMALRSEEQCDLRQLDRALDRLALLSPAAKRLLLAACARAAAADGVIAAAEGELLRAFADLWDCPLPPLWSRPAG